MSNVHPIICCKTDILFSWGGVGRGGGGFLDLVDHEMLAIASITRHLASREPSDFGISGEKNVCCNLAKADLLDSLEGKVLTACGTHLGGDLIQN